MNYRKTKIDANSAEICEHLRAHGVEVEPVPGAGRIPDALVCDKELALMEIKIEGSAAKFTRTQLQFVAGTRAPVAIVKTKESALEFARNPREKGLTQRQKDALSGFLKFNVKKFYTPKEIEAVIGK